MNRRNRPLAGDSHRPRRLGLRLRALVACAIWIFAVLVAPLLHAEEHLREAREFEEQLSAGARAGAAAVSPTATDADLAWLSLDALGREEALIAADDPAPAELDWVYGPLLAYELRTANARVSVEPDGHGASHAHLHWGQGQSDHPHSKGGHSHGSEPANPFQHGQGSLAHSGAALHVAPASPAVAAPQPQVARALFVSSASREAMPAWQRPQCAQSPPRA